MNETQERQLEQAKQMASDRGLDDAPDDFCSACVRTTPLAYDNASDIHTIKYLRKLANQVYNPETEKGTEYEWILTQIQEEYEAAFYESCADVDDCEICTDDSAECGHELHGDTCPAGGGRGA